MEYWCINNKIKPQWVEDLIDRGLLIHSGPTGITDCYQFKSTLYTTSPTYLYDGDGLCFKDDTIGVVFNLYYRNFKELKENIEMVKYYCDICGKEIFNKDDLYKLKIYRQEYNYNVILTDRDICKECANKIDDIVKRRVKN